MMRQDDALRLCELHEPSAELLREAMGRDRRVKIEQRDGFEALPAYLPPPERRGLVLVDPPFEVAAGARKADFDWMLKAARAGDEALAAGRLCVLAADQGCRAGGGRSMASWRRC